MVVALVGLVVEKVLSYLKGRGVDLVVIAKQCACIPEIEKDVGELLEKLKYADQHGLGTTRTNELLSTLLESNQELTLLLRDFITEIRLERELERERGKRRRTPAG